MIKFFKNLFLIDRVFAILTVLTLSFSVLSIFFLLVAVITRNLVIMILPFFSLFLTLISYIVICIIWENSEKENTIYIRGKRYELQDMALYKEALEKLNNEFPGIKHEENF